MCSVRASDMASDFDIKPYYGITIICLHIFIELRKCDFWKSLL